MSETAAEWTTGVTITPWCFRSGLAYSYDLNSGNIGTRVHSIELGLTSPTNSLFLYEETMDWPS